MANAFSPSSSFFGLGKEVTPGTAVVPAVYVPIKSPAPADLITYLEDKGIRGSMVDMYGEIQGIGSSEFSHDGDVFLDTIGHYLLGISGSPDTPVLTGALYAHTFSVLNNAPATSNQPPTYTLTDFDGYEARSFPSCKLADLNFKYQANGLFEYAAKWIGFKSSAVATPVPSYSAVVPFAGWTLSATVGGVSNLHIQNFELELKRGAEPIETGTGTQTPYEIFADVMAATAKFTFVIADDTELNYYLNNTQPAVVLLFTQPVTLYTLQFSLGQVAFTVGKVERGKKFVEVSAEAKLIPTAGNASAGGLSPYKIVLTNAQSTAY